MLVGKENMKRMNRFVLAGWLILLGSLSCNLNAARKGECGRSDFRLMTYNVRNAKGMDNVTDYQRVADVILRTKPDIVALQELDSVTKRSGGVDVLQELASRSLMHAVYAPAIEFGGGKYGAGVLSKEKPLSYHYIPLPGREEKRVLLSVEFEKFIFCCTHLSLTDEDRMLSLEAIRAEAKAANKPFFIAGDWNATPDSPFIAAIKEDFELFNSGMLTFPASGADRCLDYIAGYMKNGKPFTGLSSYVPKEEVASDHRPVVVDVRLKAKMEDIFSAAPYLQNPIDGGITIMWRTEVPTYSWVEFGTDTTQLKKARHLEDGEVVCNETINKIRLSSLHAGEKYYYRVCSREITYFGPYRKEFGETAVSPFYTFTLPKETSTDFTALIFNDLHKRRPTLDALYEQVKDVPYDFVLCNGDCIDDPASEDNAFSFLSYLCDKVGASRVPIFMIRGNHEIRGAFSMHMRMFIDYVGGKTYGAFNWGDTRFVTLDCGEDKPDNKPVYYDLNDFTSLRQEQVGFLSAELSGKAFKKASKRVLMNHIPLYGYSNVYAPCAELWGGLLKKAPFDVDIAAHMHRFAYHPKGSLGNNFPEVVGGGNKVNAATVMILSRHGNEMNLRVLNAKGKILLDLKL